MQRRRYRRLWEVLERANEAVLIDWNFIWRPGHGDLNAYREKVSFEPNDVSAYFTNKFTLVWAGEKAKIRGEEANLNRTTYRLCAHRVPRPLPYQLWRPFR